jgi:hypothetical protein
MFSRAIRLRAGFTLPRDNIQMLYCRRLPKEVTLRPTLCVFEGCWICFLSEIACSNHQSIAAERTIFVEKGRSGSAGAR